MQDKICFQSPFLKIKRVGLFFIIIASILILQATVSCKNVFAANNKRSIESYNEENNTIHFENDKVEAGVPLIVLNAPKASTFQWVIKAADGSVKTFTTKENSYTPTETDIEKLITVTVEGLNKTTASIYFSTLPVIYINNLKGYYGVSEEFTQGSMSMQGNKTYSDKNECYNGDISIKLRGNSTKLREKRPFNIKLDRKTDLLRMGENKHWALLANDIDHTLMRNKLLYDFSGAIGMQPYCKSENVVLIFNQEYYGVYQLCELVNLGSTRIDIFDWEDSAKEAADAIIDQAVTSGEITKDNIDRAEQNLEDAMCKDMSWITSPYTFAYDFNEDGAKEIYKITDYIKLPSATGGALLEMDFYAFDRDNASTMITAYSQPLYFKSPEYAITNKSLYQYINKYIQSFEYALHSADFTYDDSSVKYQAVNRMGGSQNPGYEKTEFAAPEYDKKHYSEFFDINSFVENFLVCEYSMNWDGMKNSVFMYKDIDDLFRIGPEWDFDWAWGNINMFQKKTWYPTSWYTTEDRISFEQYYQSVQWNRCLIKDPYFLVRVYEKYKEIRKTLIEEMVKDGGTIDTYEMEFKTAAAANDIKWGYTYSQYNSVGFQDSIINMKTFISTRLSWMDKQFESIDTLINSLGYYRTDEELKITKIDTKSVKGYAEVTVSVSNNDIDSVVFLVNGFNRFTAKVLSGQVTLKIPNNALVAQEDVLNVVQILAVNSTGSYILHADRKDNDSQIKSNYSVFYKNVDDNNTGLQTFNLRYFRKENAPYLIIILITVLALLSIAIVRIKRKHKK